MEKVAAILSTPGRHSIHGCRAQLNFSDQREHEKNCEFRWLALLNGRCETVVFTIDDADGAWFGKRLRLQYCLGRNFLLVFWREHEDESKCCCLVAQLIGDPRERRTGLPTSWM
ncbi:E3 ubiquitin-protein ligase sina-like [Dermacentor variabilis]|uniref:E3 ubiquitin-protein ligase sina-like n=1 Tax=Dermacentor variabilis TaxID=34621 RepID=UPI003F5C5BC4